MARTDRLFDLLDILRDGALHTAAELAERLGVSLRTIYRDMETLQASGVPVEGSRGVGYRTTGEVTLPPLSLTSAEIEALNLGIAIVSEAADPELSGAALSLAEKIDALMPEHAIAPSETWKFASYPFADSARGLGHLPTIRSAIRARQKLRLDYRAPDGTATTQIVHPQKIEHVGRIWMLNAWSEEGRTERTFRVDLIESAEAVPEIFTDTPDDAAPDMR